MKGVEDDVGAVALGRLALKAWDSHPPSGVLVEEPVFIATLRSVQKVGSRGREEVISTVGQSSANGMNTGQTSLASFSKDLEFGLGDDFNLDGTDWAFWDQLMQN